MEMSSQRLLKTGIILFTFELMNFCLMRVTPSFGLVTDVVMYLLLMISLLEFLWIYLLVSRNWEKKSRSRLILLLSLLKVMYLVVYISFFLKTRNVVLCETFNVAYESLSVLYYYLILELSSLCPIEVDKHYSCCIKYAVWVKILSQILRIISYVLVFYTTNYIEPKSLLMVFIKFNFDILIFVTPLASIIICCIIISMLRKVLKVYTFNRISWMDQSY